MYSSSLFLAEVVNIYPQKIINKQKLNNNIEAEVQHEAYTIDVKPASGRLQIQGVRVLSPTSGTHAQNGSGFVWMPDIGDWVVCGYLEEYSDYAVCLGALKHPFFNTVPDEGSGYNDYLVYHQSSSWMRLRDLIRYSNPSSSQTRSEIKFHHKTGAEIEMTEPNNGECEINITHPSGVAIQINNDGQISLGTGTFEPMMLGDQFKTWFQNDFMNALGQLQVMTGMGPSGPLNGFVTWANFIQTVSNSITKIFSEKNKVSL